MYVMTLPIKDGKTALEVAIREGYDGVADLLRRHAKEMETAIKVAARSSLVLLGPGGAGKTSLAVRLTKGVFDPERSATDGLEVHEWSVPERELLFSIWDLGGQVVESECPPSTGKAPGLVRLMQHCGLVYASPDGAALVPPMLPDRMKQPLDTLRGTLVEMSSESLPEPRRWWAAQYQYGRLPDNLLSRLLCRLLLLLPDAEVLDVWRFGALLRRPQRAVLALTCSRKEMEAVYIVHVAVCAQVPELLGARVSAVLGEELDGMEMKGIQYECPSCLEKHRMDKQGTFKANVLQRRAQNKKLLRRTIAAEHDLFIATYRRQALLPQPQINQPGNQ
ncbi:hypothetical protein GPECTOR_245g600 [Gonium pectorale]|uniref:C-terminal of Roc (COR) domain-containing protein n=1 Tax=Gonium pectorale TaxID=33097 RepID=A0A150FWC0_GONPE|nr:hypothetical protein GPECTOR_245g600 [Gonium pectorale]|eukprot:KXZ41912.1 hypothetical protein GPECTOR_245g600 [Gonium pectorale]